MKKVITFLAIIGISQGCSTESNKLSSEGSKVELVTEFNRDNCKSLGIVSGTAKILFESEKKLIESASIDLKNEASIMGATHVHTKNPNGDYNNSNYLKITGISYKCPK